MLYLFILKVTIYFFVLILPTGIIFSYYFLPKRLKELRLLFSPIVGLALVVVILSFVDFIGIPIGSFIVPYVLLMTAWLILLLINKSNRRKLLYTGNRLSHLPLVFLAVLLFIASMLPLVKMGYVSFYGSNTDPIVYMSLGDYLVNHSSQAQVPFVTDRPYYAFVSQVIALGTRLGPMYILAAVNKLSGNNFAINIFQIISSLIYVFGVFSIYIFSRVTIDLDKKIAMLASFFFGINTLVIHGNNYGFLSQVMSLPLIPLAITFGLLIKEKNDFKQIIYFSILVAAVLAIYPTSIIYALIIPAIALLVKAIKGKSSGIKKAFIVTMVVIFGITIVGVPSLARFMTVVKYSASSPDSELITAKGRSKAGGVRYFTPQLQVLSLGAHVHRKMDNSYGMPFNILLWVAFISSLGIIFYYVIKKKKAILGYGLVVYAIGAVILYYLTFPYGFYKHMVLSVFIFCAALAGALGYIYKKVDRLRLSIISLSLVVGALMLSSYASSVIFQTTGNPYPWVNVSVLVMRDAVNEHIPKDENLALIPTSTQAISSYLLRDRKRVESNKWDLIYFKKFADKLKVTRKTKYYLLQVNQAMSEEQNLELAKKMGKVIWSNKVFILFKAGE